MSSNVCLLSSFAVLINQGYLTQRPTVIDKHIKFTYTFHLKYQPNTKLV